MCVCVIEYIYMYTFIYNEIKYISMLIYIYIYIYINIYSLLIAGGKIVLACKMKKSLVQDLNSSCHIHFLQ